MKIIRDIKNINFNTPIVASIGAFDGVHLGHQKIINKVIQKSKVSNSKSAIITFNPLPKIFFTKKNFELISIHKKISILKNFDLDYLIILRFNKELISMSSKEFVENLMIKNLNIKSLIVGEDFKFGYNQTGDIDTLRHYSKNNYFELDIENKHSYEGERVSSSSIRKYIIAGNFLKSSKMLNRPYSISGKIMHGEKRGSQIGFPTANISLKPNILLNGVYAVTTIINKNKYHGIANIGYKPTFNGNEYIFEANIFNFSDDLYGQRLEFNIVSKIRDTKKFSGIQELQKNIKNDINMTKKYFKEHE